jgi:hypothetical protein
VTDTQDYMIKDDWQAFEFTGMLVAGPVSNRVMSRSGQPRARYATATLYQTLGGKYVLERWNMSDVYHDESRSCDPVGKSSRLWIPCRVADLSPDAIPCNRAATRQVCRPPDRRDRYATVLCERDRLQVMELPTWQKVVQQMATARHRDGFTSSVVTDLMEELLAEAERNGAVFDGPRPVTKIA